MRFYEPDGILHECVPSFPPHILSDIMNDPEMKLKCTTSVIPDFDPDRVEDWGMVTNVFSPLNLGIPVNRLRRYTWLYNKASFDLMLARSFEDVFVEEPKCGAELTLRASPVPDVSLSVLSCTLGTIRHD